MSLKDSVVHIVMSTHSRLNSEHEAEITRLRAEKAAWQLEREGLIEQAQIFKGERDALALLTADPAELHTECTCQIERLVYERNEALAEAAALWQGCPICRDQDVSTRARALLDRVADYEATLTELAMNPEYSAEARQVARNALARWKGAPDA